MTLDPGDQPDRPERPSRSGPGGRSRPERPGADRPGPAGGGDAALPDVLADLDEQGRVGVATGVLMSRHLLSHDEALAMLVELAHERGVSVARMADHLRPPGS